MFPRHLNPTYSQSKFTSPGLQCLPCFLVFSSVASFAPSVSFAQMLLELITFCSWCSTLNSMADYNFVQWLINVDFQGISPEDFKSHHWSAQGSSELLRLLCQLNKLQVCPLHQWCCSDAQRTSAPASDSDSHPCFKEIVSVLASLAFPWRFFGVLEIFFMKSIRIVQKFK